MKGDPNKIDKKILIPMIRRHFPKMIAEQIAGIQPMQSSTSNIFGLKTKYVAESWRKKIMFWPKKSIYGKFIFGLINERGVWKEVKEAISGGSYTTHTERVVEYATNREIFKTKLEGRE